MVGEIGDELGRGGGEDQNSLYGYVKFSNKKLKLKKKRVIR